MVNVKIGNSNIFLGLFLLLAGGSLLAGEVQAANDERIAYLQVSEGYWQIWIVESDGSNPRQLTHDPVDKANLSWGGKGREILYNTNQGEMFIVQVESGEKRKISLSLSGMTDGDWSPDGREIVFSLSTVGSIDNNDIWRVNADGSNLRKLTRMNGLQHDPVWCSGGDRIVFLSGEGKQNHDIFIMERDGAKPRPLTADNLYNFEPACSSRGEIAFSSNRSGNYDIWAMDVEAKQISQLTEHPGYDSSPSWSPDGKTLVFVSDRSGQLALWGMKRDGTELRQLTENNTGCRSPVWSRH